MSSQSHTSKTTYRGGCNVCHGGNVQWTGTNTAMVAAKHRRETGHVTWYEQVLRIEYTTTKGKHEGRLI